MGNAFKMSILFSMNTQLKLLSIFIARKRSLKCIIKFILILFLCEWRFSSIFTGYLTATTILQTLICDTVLIGSFCVHLWYGNFEYEDYDIVSRCIIPLLFSSLHIPIFVKTHLITPVFYFKRFFISLVIFTNLYIFWHFAAFFCSS